MIHVLLRKCICLVLLVVRIVTSPFNWSVRFKKIKKVPPITNPLLLQSATKLADLVRRKQTKSEDIVRAFVVRCKEVNPIINAIVEPRYDMALTEARNVDMLIASGTHKEEDLARMYPLLGVPMTVKESIALTGMSNEAGRLTDGRHPASRDAECVALARAAGAIPLLVSNTPEFCMCWETFNNVTGTTKNPYDTRRTAGGSSGGEATLISSAASVIGLGSDIGGSLRLPAMYNGVFGHKPTPRVVSTIGHMPDSNCKNWNKYFTIGPMTRYAEDLPLLLRVISDPNGPKLQLDKKVNMKNVNFFYMENDKSGITSRIGSDVKDALQKLIKHINVEYNKQVVKAEMKYIKDGFAASLLGLLKIEGIDCAFSKPDNPGEWISVWPMIIKKLFGCSKTTLPPLAYGPLKKFADSLSSDTIERAEHINLSLKSEFQTLLRDDGVMFFPTFPQTASFHYTYVRNFVNCTYLLLFNSLGFPVTNCPLGLTSNGMPVGIQIVAGPGCDHLTMAVAREIEKAFGGWIPPPNP